MKRFVISLVVMVLLFSVFIPVYASLSQEALYDLVQPDAPKSNNPHLLSDVTLYGLPMFWDNVNRRLMFPGAATPGGMVHAHDFGFTSADGLVLLRWTSVAPTYGRIYRLTAISRNYLHHYHVVFTGLPLAHVTGVTDARMSREESAAVFSMVYRGEDGLSLVTSDAMIRHRGQASMQYPKKNFALSLFRPDGGRNRMPLLGMRAHDNRWILDAQYIDRSKMRDRVSFNVWNSFNTPLLHSTVSPDADVMRNGVQGEFIELLIENEYWGLYCLTETINRRQLGLLSFDPAVGVQSVRYQGYRWSDTNRFRRIGNHNPRGLFWGGWEYQFPDPEEGADIVWEPLFRFVRLAVEGSDAEFIAHASDMIHIENFVDYVIFQMITYAYDNTAKNLHWSIYDITDPDLNRIFLTPWDLDALWGDSWAFSRTAPDATWMVSTSDADTELFRRLINTNAGGFRTLLEARWEELRVGALSREALGAEFDRYATLFENTGVWRREMQRWPRYNFPQTLQEEMDYIHGWLDVRWPFVDNFIRHRLDELQTFQGGLLPSRG